ncbi:hypothetical protein Tco_1093764 [Tanacetum coccineum]|uniref:Uncharacterized protein n=1 Tax=Tanacetum coccineum TaxID=301880 RepID=A0ABQ5IEU9_9ASTR
MSGEACFGLVPTIQSVGLAVGMHGGKRVTIWLAIGADRKHGDFLVKFAAAACEKRNCKIYQVGEAPRTMMWTKAEKIFESIPSSSLNDSSKTFVLKLVFVPEDLSIRSGKKLIDDLSKRGSSHVELIEGFISSHIRAGPLERERKKPLT